MDKDKDKVLLDDCMGGGKIICDGEQHWMYRQDYEAIQCLEYHPLGPCPGAKLCRKIVPQALPPVPKAK